MRETLLIIDGRGQPEALIRILEHAGFFCVYARGPLKAKALLKEHPIALIVWKDNTGNADLSRELVRVWRTHAQVPVIHLVAKESQNEARALGPQVRGRLPLEAADGRLLPMIEETLRKAQPLALGELQVRGAGGRASPSSTQFADTTPHALSSFASTGVTVDERTTLYARQGAFTGPTWRALWHRICQRLLRSRVQPGSRVN